MVVGTLEFLENLSIFDEQEFDSNEEEKAQPLVLNQQITILTISYLLKKHYIQKWK